MFIFPLVPVNSNAHNVNNSLFVYNLTQPSIKSEISKLISKLKKNAVLDLSNKNIDDTLFLYIIENLSSSSAENITIFLKKNQLTNKIFELTNPLSTGTKITKIDLSYNHFTEDASENILKILRTNLILESLNLFYNNLNTNTIQKIETALERNRQIHEEFSNYISYVALILIAHRARIPQPILDRILLQYCNMASNLEGREFISQYLIPQAKRYVAELIEEDTPTILKKITELENTLSKKCFTEQQRIIFNKQEESQPISASLTMSTQTLPLFYKNMPQKTDVVQTNNSKQSPETKRKLEIS